MSTSTDPVIATPFVKCAGGKRQLIPELTKHVPEKIARYVEPFVGGGALFFALRASGQLDGARVVLSDTNVELMAAYRAIKAECSKLVDKLRDHEAEYASRGEKYYYEVREQDSRKWSSDVNVAARFIFMNKTGWNGVYRLNGKGLFNVPHGSRKTPPVVCDAENLVACSRALRGVDLRCEDFKGVLDREERRDCAGTFVYADPPYVPLSKTSSFQYGGKFTTDHQLLLSHRLRALASLGAHVVASNASCDLVRQLYHDFDLHVVGAKRAINSKVDKRGEIDELIMVKTPVHARRAREVRA